MKRILALILASLLLVSSLTGCVSAPTSETTEETTETTQTTEAGEFVPLTFNLAYGNKSRTMTYNQSTPLTLSDGSVVSSGMLKPVWSYVAERINSEFTDITVQDASASEMIATASTTNFADANIYGGNSVGESLMNYGAEGKFVSLSDMIEAGNMPNFQVYLEENPSIASAITAYDGHIYYVPYVAEIGNAARQVIARESWPAMILDNPDAAYDTEEFTTYYEGFYVGDNVRTGENGGSVSPMEGVTITKATDENIIEIQNALPVKNGKTLATALVDYINANYEYENPSELFVGENAAYDIDELVALFRVIKANPTILSEGNADEVWPFFTRHSRYREDLLRFATYFDGVRVHGTDSYTSRWAFDENGDLVYTYAEEELYEVLLHMSDLFAEDLFYTDMFDLTNTDNFRSTLWGTDDAEDNPSYGYMTYDWIASSTNESLNDDTQAMLPPVSEVNGVWQYYIDNTRAIKPDGWAISVAGSTEEEILKACELFDFYFTEEGSMVQNYGLPMDISETETFLGPDGVEYPLYEEWVLETCAEVANGDLSSFQRDWLGSLMPIGYQKEIGFEYQNTGERGLAAWELVSNSTINYPSYAGEGLAGNNDYYYQIVPTIFSLTERQTETIGTETKIASEEVLEYVFNTIRFTTLGNAPEGAAVPSSYDDYLAYFEAAGLETYVQTYQNAYDVMTGE